MRIIDLTQTIEAGMKVYEGDPEVVLEEIHTLDKEGWRLTQQKLRITIKVNQPRMHRE